MIEQLKLKLQELEIDCLIEDDYQNFSINLNGQLALHVSPQTQILQMLKLPKDLQGLGLASLLVEIAKEVGAEKLTAQVCSEGHSQEQLVDFYEKHGFVAYFQDENIAAMELS